MFLLLTRLHHDGTFQPITGHLIERAFLLDVLQRYMQRHIPKDGERPTSQLETLLLQHYQRLHTPKNNQREKDSPVDDPNSPKLQPQALIFSI